MPTKPHKPVVPGVYEIVDGIPELGMPEGDYLTIEPPGKKNPYMLHRLVSRQIAERILASPGVQLMKAERPPVKGKRFTGGRNNSLKLLH